MTNIYIFMKFIFFFMKDNNFLIDNYIANNHWAT